ncbi:hypothetical protein IAQ61_002253 [Plenodomus lingam]|uniref:uncharacterized protein n=1 Tax=Leptosphaeria maculans TaxID=5022 RepID=UPI0033337BEF|nr:hypothetical protein IAQ61_002253 [Plenodomus lingam]
MAKSPHNSPNRSGTCIRKSDISRPISDPKDLPHQLNASALSLPRAESQQRLRLPSLSCLRDINLGNHFPETPNTRPSPTQLYYSTNIPPPLPPPVPLKISKSTHKPSHHHDTNPHTPQTHTTAPEPNPPSPTTSPPSTLTRISSAFLQPLPFRHRARRPSHWLSAPRNPHQVSISPSIYSSDHARSSPSPSPEPAPRRWKSKSRPCRLCVSALCAVVLVAALVCGVGAWVRVSVVTGQSAVTTGTASTEYAVTGVKPPVKESGVGSAASMGLGLESSGRSERRSTGALSSSREAGVSRGGRSSSSGEGSMPHTLTISRTTTRTATRTTSHISNQGYKTPGSIDLAHRNVAGSGFDLAYGQTRTATTSINTVTRAARSQESELSTEIIPETSRF